jgi:hypothetical protein
VDFSAVVEGLDKLGVQFDGFAEGLDGVGEVSGDSQEDSDVMVSAPAARIVLDRQAEIIEGRAIEVFCFGQLPIGDHFTCHIGSEFTATVGSPTEELFGVVAFRDDSGRVASDVLAAFDDAVEFDDGSGLLGRIEEGLEVRRDSAGDFPCVLGPFGQFGIAG